jgi:Xaa-Pro aminopeptidase
MAPLKKGAIITIEPGIYLPDEAIGIRIEDDILVTASGRKNLSKAIPKTVAEIEKAMTR